MALHLSNTTFSLVEIKDNRIQHRQSANYAADGWQKPLRTMLSEMASGSQLHLVLSPDFYQLVQLDKPELSASEMLQALPWQVKDLVSISPEDIIADYIDLPGHATQQPKINVVVARLSWLKQLVQEIQHAGVHILSIQPEEWLAVKLIKPAAHATMLVIHQPEQEVLIQIVRDGLLYFSRRTRGFGQLHLSSEAELRAGVLDRLQLELQRSMDYFESQLKQAPVRDIRVLLHQADVVSDVLSASGFSRVETLTVQTVAQTLNTPQLISCWPAVAVLSAEATEPAA